MTQDRSASRLSRRSLAASAGALPLAAPMVNTIAPGRMEIIFHGAGEIAGAFAALEAVGDG